MRNILSLVCVTCFCVFVQFQAVAGSFPESTELMTITEVVEDARDGVDIIDNNELIERINANPELVLLDVRNKEEYDAGHLKGATWLERGVVEFTLARTLRKPEAEIIVYCVKKNRSSLVVKALKRMGYKNVKSHVGIEGWIAEGHSLYNYLGEIQVIKLREVNAATKPIEYYLDKSVEK
jgi:Rhodanese-related sulfurtransferase